MSSRTLDPNAAVEAAIARILTAEREAQTSIEQCRRDGESAIEAARAAVRALEQRTERRIGSIRAAFEQRTKDAVAQLDAQASALEVPHAMSEEDVARVSAAVAALAGEITGESG